MENNIKVICTKCGGELLPDQEGKIYRCMYCGVAFGSTVLFNKIATELLPYMNIYRTGDATPSDAEGGDEIATPVFEGNAPDISVAGSTPEQNAQPAVALTVFDPSDPVISVVIIVVVVVVIIGDAAEIGVPFTVCSHRSRVTAMGNGSPVMHGDPAHVHRRSA